MVLDAIKEYVWQHRLTLDDLKQAAEICEVEIILTEFPQKSCLIDQGRKYLFIDRRIRSEREKVVLGLFELHSMCDKSADICPIRAA